MLFTLTTLTNAENGIWHRKELEGVRETAHLHQVNFYKTVI